MKIIIAVVLLVGLVLLLALVITGAYFLLRDPWKAGHTEKYLDYVEWKPSYPLGISGESVEEHFELVGRYREDRAYYYAFDSVSSDHLVVERKAFSSQSRILYNPQTVSSPEILFENRHATLSDIPNNDYAAVYTIEDKKYLDAWFDSLMEAELTTESAWLQSNGAEERGEKLLSMIFYLEKTESVSIWVELYRVNGLYYWMVPADFGRCLYVPFDSELFTLIGIEY